VLVVPYTGIVLGPIQPVPASTLANRLFFINQAVSRKIAQKKGFQLRNAEDEEKIIIRKEKYRPIKSGIYKARFISWIADLGAFKQDVFRLFFQITEGMSTGRILEGWVNKTENGQKGKLWQLYRAIKKTSLKPGDEMRLSDLIGGECYINIEKRGHKNAITEYIESAELHDLREGGIFSQLQHTPCRS